MDKSSWRLEGLAYRSQPVLQQHIQPIIFPQDYSPRKHKLRAEIGRTSLRLLLTVLLSFLPPKSGCYPEYKVDSVLVYSHNMK